MPLTGRRHGLRTGQREFIARGRASLAKARRTGELYDADDVFRTVQDRLGTKVTALRQDTRAKKQRP